MPFRFGVETLEPKPEYNTVYEVLYIFKIKFPSREIKFLSIWTIIPFTLNTFVKIWLSALNVYVPNY